jgi:hypothetical protein
VVAYRDGGPAAVALVAVLGMLPAAIVTPFAATLADRHRRDHVLVGVGLVRATIARRCCRSAGRRRSERDGLRVDCPRDVGADAVSPRPLGPAADPVADAGRAHDRERRARAAGFGGRRSPVRSLRSLAPAAREPGRRTGRERCMEEPPGRRGVSCRDTAVDDGGCVAKEDLAGRGCARRGGP